MICAFTGHRPQRLPWGGDEQDPRCQALKTLLDTAIQRAAERGCDTFLCGMARGCDTYFAEAVLARGLRLEAMVPCPEQADSWQEADRKRYHALLLRCAAIHVLETAYSEGCMVRRNRVMVDRADSCVCYQTRSEGGTAYTVGLAVKKGLPLYNIAQRLL